jgi:hypothetical protein
VGLELAVASAADDLAQQAHVAELRGERELEDAAQVPTSKTKADASAVRGWPV